MSVDRQGDKEDVADTHREMLLSHKQQWTEPICSNVRTDPEITVSSKGSEGSQAEQDKDHMLSLTCGIVKRYK